MGDPIKLSTPEQLLNKIPTPAPAIKKEPGSVTGDELKNLTPKEGMTGTRQPFEWDEFDFTPKPGTDNYKLRAQNQSWYEQLGKGVGNTVLNIPLGLAEGIGYLGTLMETGDDRDYSNSLTELMQKWHNPLGEVYQENPNKTIDMGDPAWWINNVGGLVESAGEFALLGAGTASVFGKLAELAAYSARAGKIAAGAANVLSAATLSYVEGAMSGTQVYKNVYDNRYKEYLRMGADPIEANQRAKVDAANGAARTVQMNTIMNTGLNLTILAPLFRKEEGMVNKWWASEGQQKPGESLSDYKARLQASGLENSAVQKSLEIRENWQRFLLEPLQEGIEEVNTQYAESEGQREKPRDIGTALTDLDGYLKAVSNDQGILNFALGSLGGILHPMLLDNIPIKKVDAFDAGGNPIVDEEGNRKKNWVSTRTFNERGYRKYFDSIKDAIIKDVDTISTITQDLKKAVEQKDVLKAEQLRNELTSIHYLNAITLGKANVWKEQYRQIASMDNQTSLGEAMQKDIDAMQQQIQQMEESPEKEAAAKQFQEMVLRQASLMEVTPAMQAGYAESKQDNKYKERALKAVQQLDDLQSMFDNIQAKMDTGSESDLLMTDHLFWRTANQYLNANMLKEQEARILQMKDKRSALSATGDLLDYLKGSQSKVDTLNKVVAQLQEAQEALKSGDVKRIQDVVKQVRPIIFPGDSPEKMAEATIRKLNRSVDQINKLVEDANKEHKDNLEIWEKENPGKVLSDELKHYNWLDSTIQAEEAALMVAKINHERAEEELNAMGSSNNLSKLRKELEKDMNKAMKVERAKQFDALNRKYQETLDKENVPIIQAQQENLLRNKLQVDKDILERDMTALKEAIRTTAAELVEAKKNRESIRRKKELSNRLKGFQYQMEQFKVTRQALEKQLAMDKLPISVVQKGIEDDNPAPSPDRVLQDYNYRDVPEEERFSVFAAILGDVDRAREFEGMMKIRRNEITPNAVVAMFKRLYLQTYNKDVSDANVRNFLVPYIKERLEEFQQMKIDPDDEYYELLEHMPPLTKQILGIFESSPDVLSFDALKYALSPAVASGELSVDLIPKIAQKLHNYIKFTQANSEPGDVETPVEGTGVEEPVLGDETGAEIPTEIPQPDSPDVTQTNSGEVITQEQSRMHMGAQSRDGAKVNYNTMRFNEITTPEGNFGYLRFSDQLDDNLNLDNITPGRINVGDDIMLIVDEKWQGEINYDEDNVQDEFGNPMRRKDSFQNYIDSNGKVIMNSTPNHMDGGFANMPIKIIHVGTNKVIGYVPRVDWITARHPNSSNYKHILDTFIDPYTKEEVTNNVAAQKKRVLAIRRAVAASWNADKNKPIVSKVSNRSAGHLFINQEVKPELEKARPKRGSAARLIPGNVQIGYVREGAIQMGIKSNFEGKIDNEGVLPYLNGVPVTLLPTPTGGYMAAPLYNHMLGANPSTLNTIERAIELYLLAGMVQEDDLAIKQRQKILETTGFDLSTERGLKEFINQYYTHTQPFRAEDVLKFPSQATGKATETFLFDIPDTIPGEDKARIKIGVSYSGSEPIYLKLNSKGKLDADASTLLRKGLSNRFFNVQYKKDGNTGINDNVPIKEVMIQANGVVKVTNHDDYNSYLKSKSETYVYGLNKGSDGKYVYTANSVINFDYNEVFKQAPAKTSVAIGENTATQDEDTEFLASLLNGSIDRYASLPIESVATPKNGSQVTLEFLQNLSNFTPEEIHNGKTADEVLQELQKAGITSISPLHNPFQKC